MRKLYLFLLSVIVAGALFQSKAFTDLYIRGGQFGWEAKNCTDANKFTTTDGNVYKITLETLKSGFKIATVTSAGEWDNNFNFGSASNIEPGNEYTLITAWDSGNITTKGGVDLTNVTLTFTLSTKKLKVEGQAEEAKYPEALYMVGDFNGWNTSDASYKMTREGDTGKYVIKNVNIEKGKQIKFCTGSWANNWGAATDGDPLPVGTEFIPKYNASNYKLTEALKDATVEFYYNIESIESAKAKVTNGGDIPTPPETYTVKFDNSVTKWETVSAYFFGGEYEGSVWPGVAMTKESGDIWTVSIEKGTVAPTKVIFNDGNAEGARQTSEFAFEDGKTYKAELKTITVKYNNGKTKWNKVYAYFWKEGAGDVGPAWHGTEMTLESGTIYTVSLQVLDLPTNVKFNDGADAEGNAETFENGKTYGEADDPTPPEPEYPELYVRGSFTDYEAKPEYKMAREGKVYTITGIEIPEGGKFKIADNTTNWKVNFGGTGIEGVLGDQTDELTNGTEKNAWFNSSVNFTVAKKLTNATVTFTFEGAKDGVASKIKVEGTEEVTPPEPGKYTVKFDNSVTKWETVSAYFFGGEYEGTAWPGVAMTKESGDIWTVSIDKGTVAPTKVMFNDGKAEGAKQTSEFTFEDGKTYKAELKTISVKYNNGATKWNKVYAYFWKEGAGDVGPAWPGTEMTLESGTTYTVSLQVLDFPTNVKFNDGDAAEGEAETFENGKTYGEGGTPIVTYPENLYVIGQVDGATGDWTADHGVALAKNGAVYTVESITVEDAGEGSGYIGLATQLGTTADDWDSETGINGADRYGADVKNAPLVAGTPSTIVKYAEGVNASSAYSWKVAAGTYSLTADLENMTISIVKKNDPQPTVYTVKFDNSATKWETVSAYFFGGEYEGTAWPGVAMTKESGDIWTVSIEKDKAAPESVIFNDGKAEGAKQTSAFAFENGKTYKAELKTVTVKYNNGKTAWGDVYAYFWKDGQGTIGEAWPGTKMTLEEGTVYTVTFQALELPTKIKFHNNAGDESEEYAFENGKTYGEGATPGPEIPEHPEFYLVGSMADPAFASEWKFICDEATNVYTLSGVNIPADANFWIAPKDNEYPEIVYGAASENEAPVMNTTVNLVKGRTAAKMFKASEAMNNATLVFTYVADGTSTLNMTWTTGIEGIESGIDGDVEYYNMQGVRVMNPQEGIYIVRRGNKVTKETVRR